MSNLGQLGFANQLKIPPLLEPRGDGTGRKIFDLRLQQGTSRFLPATSMTVGGALVRSAAPRHLGSR
jgi:suppressor of ftsI